jgi:primosomal protein N' (replication factor Y)
VVIPPLDGDFLYGYSALLDRDISVGDVVEVPLGRRTTHAYVTSVNSAKEVATKHEMASRGITIRVIASESSPERAFNKEHLAFYEWIASYYAEPLSKVLDLAIPTPAPSKAPVGYRLTNTHISGQVTAPKRGSIQSRILEILSQSPESLSAAALKATCGASSATLRALVQKNLIELAPLPILAEEPLSIDLKAIEAPILNSEQLGAVSAIRSLGDTFSTSLIQGVTGSGKTEVYLTLILDALNKGLSALVIVPEIALTPQLTERFISRLQQPVAVLHSSLKPKERWRHWSDLLSGRVRVAIGARSAIFAPLDKLGLIVVDEEHDSSFKQGEGIRYHARDLALVRAKLSRCPVILGSATPSLESYNNARSGKYTHLHLRQRYHDAAQSSFEIVDLNKVKPWEMKSKSISPTLFSALHKTFAKGGQAFILYNRRGFASYLQCSSCEHVLGCPHCSVTLTYHRNTNSLICHQCSFTMVPPGICNGCGAREKMETDAEPLFAHRGSGTERVHEELGQLFPSARIAVLDRDTASSVEDYVEILRRVREREVDILVGTQMIAKGHDLPGVTFVGIVDCDVGLHIPDFRASERSFQLLTQVSGRAGRRSEKGHVVLQTRVPTHPSLVLTAAANYDSFADQELQLRREMLYPPFHKLLRVIISASERSVALESAARIADTAQTLKERLSIQILGPAPAPIEKIRTLWRYHIIMRSPSTSSLQHAMKQLKKIFYSTADLRVSYDLDPHDML